MDSVVSGSPPTTTQLACQLVHARLRLTSGVLGAELHIVAEIAKSTAGLLVEALLRGLGLRVNGGQGFHFRPVLGRDAEMRPEAVEEGIDPLLHGCLVCPTGGQTGRRVDDTREDVRRVADTGAAELETLLSVEHLHHDGTFVGAVREARTLR